MLSNGPISRDTLNHFLSPLFQSKYIRICICFNSNHFINLYKMPQQIREHIFFNQSGTNQSQLWFDLPRFPALRADCMFISHALYRLHVFPRLAGYVFSRVLYWLHGFALDSDWSVMLFVFIVIGQSDFIWDWGLSSFLFSLQT